MLIQLVAALLLLLGSGLILHALVALETPSRPASHSVLRRRRQAVVHRNAHDEIDLPRAA